MEEIRNIQVLESLEGGDTMYKQQVGILEYIILHFLSILSDVFHLVCILTFLSKCIDFSPFSSRIL